MYIESHYADLLKKERVIKLLATREGDLKEKLQEHINKRVDENYPPNLFDTSDGAVPETIVRQALGAMAKEPLQLKKSPLGDGKKSVGHDVSVSDGNDVFASLRPSVGCGWGERHFS